MVSEAVNFVTQKQTVLTITSECCYRVIKQDLMKIVTLRDMSHNMQGVTHERVISVSSNMVCLHILPWLPLMCTMIATSWPPCDPWFAVLHLANLPGFDRDMAGLCP